MPHDRIEICFKPGNLLTCIGQQLQLRPRHSHLRILNSIQLIKINTSSQQSLKIGESFYMHFHFSGQYLMYDPARRDLALTRNTAERGLFKILTDEFEWNSRGGIEMGALYKYRIILAEYNSKYLAHEAGQLIATGKCTDSSLVSFERSLYTQGSIGYPTRLRALQSGLTLCAEGVRPISLAKPSICEYLVSFEYRNNSDLWAIKHVDSNAYLVKSGHEFLLMKQAPASIRYCFKIHRYDNDGEYLMLQTVDNLYLRLCDNKCELSTELLTNVLEKQNCNEDALRNILVSAWLKSEIPLPPNQSNIKYILGECERNFQHFSEVYSEAVVTGLVVEGLLVDLDYIANKYEWGFVGPRIVNIVKFMLKVKKSLLAELFTVINLYRRLMHEPDILPLVSSIQLGPESLPNPPKTLHDASNIILNHKQIDLTSLVTILVISPLLRTAPRSDHNSQLIQFVEHTCEELVGQTRKQVLSGFYAVGVRIVRANTSLAYFNSEIVPWMGLQVVMGDKLDLRDKIDIIEVICAEVGPYIYVSSEEQSVRVTAHNKKNQQLINFYIEDVLTKNCMFETYDNKLIAVSLLPYHLAMRQNLDLQDCKQYLRYLHESITTYNYQQNSEIFIRKAISSMEVVIRRMLVVIVEKNLQYDSITHQLEQRVKKCKKQFESVVSVELLGSRIIWDVFWRESNITDNQSQIFMLTVELEQLVLCPEPFLRHYLQAVKVVDQISPSLHKSLSLLLTRQYEYNPAEASQKMTSYLPKLSQEQLHVISTTIHENNLYEKLCYKSESFYRFLIGLAEVDSASGLDGERIIDILMSRKNQWMFSECEFRFLSVLLKLVGGVVTLEIYHSYKDYVCDVKPDLWSLAYFQLCDTFFAMSPLGLKKKFVIEYQAQLKSTLKLLKIETILHNKPPEIIVAYLKMLVQFSHFHANKQFLYQLLGDECLFRQLAIDSDNTHKIIIVLQLMINSRKRYNQFEDISNSPANTQWLKQSTIFIRKQLQKQELAKEYEPALLKQYTFTIIDFLQMREQVARHTEITEDELLAIEATNKLLAFEIVEWVEAVANTCNIQSNLLQKIEWFEDKYKLNVNSIELAHMAIKQKNKNVQSENFVYSYSLQIDYQLEKCIDHALTKIDMDVLLTWIIKIILSICFSKAADWHKLMTLLNYLHCLVSSKDYQVREPELKLLFLAMRQLMSRNRLRSVALMQNIIRKTIWKNGQLDRGNQAYAQQQIMDNKSEFYQFFYQCIENYMTFCPTYTSTLNYFNSNGQKSINWAVTNYISNLRFLICLCKSLNPDFKQIFSQVHISRKQFLGTLIELNQQHIRQMNPETSDTKLTIIAYEIELINNMMRGPIVSNIETALKFDYDRVIDLIKFGDQYEVQGKVNTFKIIVEIKKLVADAIIILAPFRKFAGQQIRVIEEGLIFYYDSTQRVFSNDNLDKIIEIYTKQNKNKIQVMVFDLALNLFFGLIRIYEKQGNQVIKQMRTDILRRARLVKIYNKRFKMFYQIYKIIAELIGSLARCVYRCCKKTATGIDEAMNLFAWEQDTHAQNLNKSFEFFVRNVSTVEIQVGDQAETIYFLLMKETRCYNVSIRKELHRKIGLGDRQYRLNRFMGQADHVILRLEIEKSIKNFTEKYKPIEIIIKNRQLWKSMNFLCACLLNLIFLDMPAFPDPDVPLYILRALSYIFCIFLYMIYFIQNLPLKKKLAAQMQKSAKPPKFVFLKSFLQIFRDKTLWFATIYFVIISLSIYQLGFVCLLMIDFFVRFKISKKVTEIVTRPMIQLLLIVLISVQVAYIFTGYQYFIGQGRECQNTATCIQSTYEQYLGLYKNLVDENVFGNLKLQNIFDFLFAFFSIMINSSLIISVLLYQKKAKDVKKMHWEQKVRERCFICDNDRNVVDRARNNNRGFFEHIEEEHNLWSYYFYLIYLKNREIERLNIVENMVLQQWKNKTIEWFPMTFKFKPT